MPDPVPQTDLLLALRCLVRGLSALFWGLPLALIVCVKTSVKDKFEVHSLDCLGPLVTMSLVFYGLMQLGAFQKQERIWQQALDRAKVFALTNLGLAPFLYWRLRLPDIQAFALAALMLAICGLVFLLTLNQLLQRLVAMLPDEALRQETQLFTTLNQYLLMVMILGIPLLVAWLRLWPAPPLLAHLLMRVESLHQWIFLFFTLLPLAMTMALIWKIKEVVLAGVFGSGK